MISEYHIRRLTATNLERKNHLAFASKPHGFAKAGIGSYILNIPHDIVIKYGWQNEKKASLLISLHSVLAVRMYVENANRDDVVTTVLHRGTRSSPSMYIRIPKDVIAKLGWILGDKVIMVPNDSGILTCQRWKDTKRLFRWLVKTGGDHDRRTLVRNAYRDLWLGQENFEHLLRAEQEEKYLQKIARLRAATS